MTTDIAMRSLEQLEQRLNVTLPHSYRVSFSLRPVFTEIRDFELLRPDQCERCENVDLPKLRRQRGVLIGRSVGGDVLFLALQAGSETQLGEAVFVMDLVTAEITRVADRFEDLLHPLEPLERIADELLDKHGGEALETNDAYWDGPAERGGRCRFCGSGLRDGPACPVCGRSPLDADDADRLVEQEATRLATALVLRLLTAGELELVNDRSHAAAVLVAATVLQEVSGLDAQASHVVEGWVRCPDVAEVFVDDEKLRRLIAELKSDRA